MAQRRKDGAKTYAARLDALLDEVCDGEGYCLPRIERERLSRLEEMSAQGFALEMLRIEGFPVRDDQTEHMRYLEACFVKHFGAERAARPQPGMDRT